MKKLHLLSILLTYITAHNIGAMQQETSARSINSTIEIHAPIFVATKNHFEISAHGEHEKTEIGHIWYDILPWAKNNKWQIKHFFVKENYRKQGIGLKLFKACITDIRSKSADSITWFVAPIWPSKIEGPALIAIYKTLIEKTDPELSKKTTVKNAGFGDLTHPRFTINFK